MEGANGNTNITVSAPGFTDGIGTVNIVQPAYQIEGLSGNTTLFSTNDPFQVVLGVPNFGNTGLSGSQSIRAGGNAVTATVTNSDPDVGQLFSLSGIGQVQSVQIYPGQMGTGSALSFDPLGVGNTTVSVSIPGFIATNAATKSVTVSSPGITFSGFPLTVGAGLQEGSLSVNLGGSLHGGVTVRVESNEPSIALVSPNRTTSGSAFIDILIANGSTTASFFVQGVEGAAGSSTITASAPGFLDGSGNVNLVQPAFQIEGLENITTTFSGNDSFQIVLGIPHPGNSGLSSPQSVRAGGNAVTATVTNSDSSVGRLVTQENSGQSVTVQIQPGESGSIYDFGNTNVAFYPLGPGTTTVSASIPGFIATGAATQNVRVSTPGISLSGFPQTIGAGLQYGSFSARLNSYQHGGVTVRIESSDPSIALVSQNSSTPGEGFIEVPLANGLSFISFYVQGVEGATGDTTILVSAPGFSDETGGIKIVQPGYTLSGLEADKTLLSPNDSFQVGFGIPNSGNTGLSSFQSLRAGGSAVTATFTNSEPTVGQLVTQMTTGQSVTVQIQPGQSGSESQIAFEPLGVGNTTVSVSIPDFIATGGATQNVTVSTPEMSLTGFPKTIGAGLQTGWFYARLEGSEHGGLTVRIESSNPAISLISPNGTTAGEHFIEVSIPDGSTSVPFYVQGVEGSTGSATITASAPGFTDGSGDVDIVPAAFQISGLMGTTTSFSPDDFFQVVVGIANSENSGLEFSQPIRMGSGTVTATLQNGDSTVAQLVTQNSSGQNITVQIQPGQSSSGYDLSNGGVAFDPLGAGTTTVSASIPGFIATDGAIQNVVVSTPEIDLSGFGFNMVGAGLQINYSAFLGGSEHGGVTVRIESSNPSVALVSPENSTAGSAFIDIPVTNGSSRASFYIQGVGGNTGRTTITASAPGFTDDLNDIDVVLPSFGDVLKFL